MSILVEDDVTWTHFTTCFSPYGKCGDLKSDTQQNATCWGLERSLKKHYSTLSCSWRDALPVRSKGCRHFSPAPATKTSLSGSMLQIRTSIKGSRWTAFAGRQNPWLNGLSEDGSWWYQQNVRQKSSKVTKKPRFLGFLDLLKKILRKLHVDSIFFSRVRNRWNHMMLG